jgi:putative restriction endonuclease
MYLSSKNRHPARYVVFRDEQRYRTKVYIWTVTHGGKGRASGEYRIQPTGIKRFEPEIGGKTLILGWWPDAEVFAGYDLRYHSGQLGSSPSIQIGEAALTRAASSGFSPSRKATGELAVAFQAEFLGTYIQHLEEIHDSGKAPKEVALLERLGGDPSTVTEREINRRVAKKRRFVFVEARRALRDLDFSKRVFTAYSHQCAMCGIQLRLLEGAHIVPVADPSSTDETSNGIALCALHHKAYDDALVTFDAKHRIHLNAGRIRDLRNSARDGGLTKFRETLRSIIHLPPDSRDRPRREYVDRANELRGWML